MSQVERVVRALSRHGRIVSAEEIERQLGGFDGLPAEAAGDALLRTYRLAPDGAPLPGFEPDRTSVQVVVSLLRESRWTVAFVLVAALIGLVPAIGVPLLMRLFVDRYIVAQDTTWGAAILLAVIGAAVIAATVVALQSAVLERLTVRLTRTGSVGFVWSTLTMCVPRLQAYGTGYVIARRVAVHNYSYQGGVRLPQALVNSLTAVVFLVMIFLLDTVMGVAAIVIVVASLLISRVVLARRNPVQRSFSNDRVRLTGFTSDVVTSAESIKAAAWEQFAFSRWAETRQRMSGSSTRLGVADQQVTLVPILAQTVGLGVFLAIGVAQVFAGTVSLGTVVAAQAYMVSLLTTAGMLVLLGVILQELASAHRQFGPVLREPMDPEMLTVTTMEPRDSGDPPRLTGALSLRRVSFGYDPEAAPLLVDLSLEVAAARRIALVGPSGSGKTTIAKLIVGELRPWSGFVTLDDVPRLGIPRERRTRDVAYVPQTSVLFPGTIRDNLTLWDDSHEIDALERAARDACIADTILGRPGGFFHEVTSADGGFSGGEMQRLAIARALVDDPRIIVLDEATSALDPVVEAEVEARLRARGVTAIVIAHRLSTIRDADEILVVDGGRIVQRGPFAELVREGLFAELVHG
ncbi:MAG: ATP-binding cassette domain-containing protein [Actinobacteria bacterium]|nr:ATP-binding cassette domain-containing protein [Actinomycetota bacterium]